MLGVVCLVLCLY